MPADMAHMALDALIALAEPMHLLMLVGGVLIGLAIGCLPGLSGVVALAILIPFTYHLDAHDAFALLLGMAAVTTTSDLIPAVLFGVPGTVGAAATVLDGHADGAQGRSGQGVRRGLHRLAVRRRVRRADPGAGPAAVAAGTAGDRLAGAACLQHFRPVDGRDLERPRAAQGPDRGRLGLMLAMIGSGSQAGTLRWTFDWLYLWDGLPLIPVTLGIFAVPELADMAIERRRIAGDGVGPITLSSQWQGVRDVWRYRWLLLRCSALGTALGTIPGIGSAVIDWIVYGYAQRTERDAESFGTGDVRGVIAPESANNAKEGGHLVPTIAFGVPAGASMTLLLGAFLMHGLVPGPEMLTKHLDVTYTIIWSLTLGHVLGAAICVCGSRWLARLSGVRPEILLPVILPIVFVAAFQGSRGWGDLFSLLGFGVVGWGMKRLDWPRPPLILGLVIGSIFERYLFISTGLFGAGWMLRPVVLCVGVLILWALYRPMAGIVQGVVRDLRSARGARPRLAPQSAVTLAVIAVVVAALVDARFWPASDRLVPETACIAALIAATLNLATELFGVAAPAGGVLAAARARAAPSKLAGAVVARRAGGLFLWLAGFIALVAVVGFIPAIGVFTLGYMRLNFGEPWPRAAIAGAATALFCWAVFDQALAVPWPHALLGDVFPALRDATSLM